MKDKYLSIDEILSQKNIQHLSVNNIGDKIVYVLRETDWHNNDYTTKLWLYDSCTKNHRIISELSIKSKPLWSSNDTEIAFIASVKDKKESKNQVFLLNTKTQVVNQVTNHSENVSNLKWSNDYKGIYFLAANEVNEDIKTRNERYGEFIVIDEEYSFNSIFYIDIDKSYDKKRFSAENRFREEKCDDKEENESTKIIGEDYYIRSFDIDPVNNKIAYTQTSSPEVNDYMLCKVHLYDIDTKENSQLKLQTLANSIALFSPDGTKLCLRISDEHTDYYTYRIDLYKLAIYDLQTKKISKPYIDSDKDIYPIEWHNKGIIVRYQQRGRWLLGILRTDGYLEELHKDNDDVMLIISLNKDGTNIAQATWKENKLQELYYNGVSITNFSQMFSDKQPCVIKHITWKSSDGLEVGGILTLPQDFNKNHKYPLLVVVHGGPRWASLKWQASNRYYPVERFIEKGFIVLQPNYRGSTGYGEDFIKANYKKLGFGDYEDIASGVDHLISQGYINEDKVGVMGWSQGGYISAYCSTYSNKFKAISVGAGISDWKTYYVQTDIPCFTKQYLGNDPWSDKEIYEKTSPMKHIKTACTPTLIQHGEKDIRVPVANGYELYRALKDMGITTKLIIYKGMKHGAHKPGLNKAIMEQNLNWFSHYILGEELKKF